MNTKSKSRAKTLIRLFLALILLAFALLGFTVSMIYLNKQKVGDIIVSELNKSLKTEISVEEIDMVFISTFPFVSLEFRNVFGKEVLPEGKTPDTLFYAGVAYLKFNLIDIYKKHYSIKQITVEDAAFYMKIFKDGSNNYVFWKTSEEGSAISLDLEKINIANSQFTYRNYGSKQFYDIFIYKSVSRGQFNSGWNQIKTRNDLLVNTIQIDKAVFAKNTPAFLEMTFLHNGNNNEISISDNKLILNRLPFTVKGSYNYSETQFVDAVIESRKISLKEVLDILPQEYKKSLGSFKTTGILDISAKIKGSFANGRSPEILADFRIDNGMLESKKNNIAISNIKLSGSFSNGDKHSLATSEIDIKNFSMNLNEGFFDGKFSLSNLKRPVLNGNISADFDLAILRTLFEIKNIDNLSGKLKADIAITGRIDDLSKGQAYALEQCKFNGDAFISDGFVKLKDLRNPLEELNTNLVFTNKRIEVAYLNTRINKTDVSFSGEIQNLLNYLFSDDELHISGSAIANKLNLDEFFEKQKSDTKSGISFPKNISSDIILTITNFRYRNLKSNDVKTQLLYKNNRVSLENTSLSAWGGRINGNVIITSVSDAQLSLQGNAGVKKIDIGSLFSTFDNFGQQMFTPENLKGIVNADVKFGFLYNSSSGIDLNSLKTVADMKLENGELINIVPLMKLSSFLDENSLKHIKFKTLTNSFVIQNRVLEIPEMTVASNAVNFNLYGKHTFDNEIDYHFRLHLSELAGKRQRERLKKEQETF
ncbi:hypothetical protein LJC16_03150, partial [Bacteroidales bacterium OttesenSCG-928-C19]|nr:hypothetical protein [Bacteroidales bacterium OttesenSCG-928-C19]